MILDANTGAVLHDEDGDEPRHPASLTKMMTLYLTFDTVEQGRMSLSSMVKISQEAASVAPSKLELEPGEEISVADAVRAVITKSANDVAVALAEKIGGSQANFVRLMNAKAGELGMSKTHFENASGLPDPEQVTTAHDMITLALHLQDDFPQHYPLFAMREFRYNGHSLRNHNTLMNSFTGIDGIKTGYTQASGFNLVSSLRRNGRHLVGAVFGGQSAATRNGEMRTLLTRALNRASPTRTRKPSAYLIAKIKSEPKLAVRPAKKAAAVVAEAKPAVVAEKPAPAPRPALRSPPQTLPVEPPAASPGVPTSAVEAEKTSAAEPAPPPPGTTLQVAKVRHVMVAPRQGPKRPPPKPSETTDMAATEEGETSGPDPAVSETIVPKSSAPAHTASLPATTASMLGAADVAADAPLAPATVTAPVVAKAATPAPEPRASKAASAAKREQREKDSADKIAPAKTQKPEPAMMPAAATAAGALSKVRVARTLTVPPGLRPSTFEAQASALKTGTALAANSDSGSRFEIQVGAYASLSEAQRALSAVQTRAGPIVASHPSVTHPVSKDGRQVYRARFRGFDANAAASACQGLRKQAFDCFVMVAE